VGSLNETNPSLWVETTRDRPLAFPRLSGTIEVDVAVIGAGIAGLLTATLLKEAGASVAVVEAGRICSGATAYTTAKITSLHGLAYAGLASNRSDDVARAYGEANQAGLALIARLVAERSIDCDFSRRAAYTYTADPDQLSSVQEEAEVAAGLGLPATFTTDTELPFPVLGAVRFDDQAQFHPRRFCLALAQGLGEHVYESSRVRDVDAESDESSVLTEDGTVRARHVVVATHLPFLDRGMFFAKCHPARSYAMAIEMDGEGPTGMYLSAESPTRSLRAAESDRYLVVGGEGHKVGQSDDTRVHYRALEAWAAAHFPGRPVVHRWSAQDHMPVDGTPFVGPLLPGSNVLVATGFNKWGMSNGAAAALMLADHIAGRDNPWAEAFDATRQGSAITSSKLWKENADAGKHMVGDRLAAIRADDADTLAPGAGGIVELDGERVAAFRDDDGTLHAVSSVCKHLGCLVSFNTAERTWDCPCHGSRYGIDGRVIEGPAVADLDPLTGSGDG
jgi:glycine/D-amino acid oxidase-like deaminating enzyme/nitrite reductase/ring-hydroxylating ferredoxin subunit